MAFPQIREFCHFYPPGATRAPGRKFHNCAAPFLELYKFSCNVVGNGSHIGVIVWLVNVGLVPLYFSISFCNQIMCLCDLLGFYHQNLCERFIEKIRFLNTFNCAAACAATFGTTLNGLILCSGIPAVRRNISKSD